MPVLLLASMLFSALALILIVAYFVTGAKKMILMRLAGASALIASAIWLYRMTAR